MSAPGPESIPLSADPRHKRPPKNRNPTDPVSQQASHLESLFARPDQEIRIPTAGSTAQRRLPLPPEIVTNVQGSSAGAGSGEFHVYKAARRREYERLRIMDEEVKREEEQREFEVKKTEHEDEDRKKTERNRVKREKMKARKEKAKAAAVGSKKNGAGKQADDAAVPHHGGVKARTLPVRNTEQDDSSDKMAIDPKEGEAQRPAATATGDIPGLLIHDDD
ncbi:hypothetical protein BD289DRAFT_436209 [Coniella lustricola]|uniref:DUF1168 domain protein n=1 Tax=Coniella lustricola TaxID=2025994 RepID=A0A2T3A5L5_9PEZI|nr:hypothetical protein BD289DRAFT_436209 [Coniella lustricola]